LYSFYIFSCFLIVSGLCNDCMIGVACYQVLSKDSVTVNVDAVVYYRVEEPLRAVVMVNNYR
jgi:hypothetical protein